jgi:hypothetical protein
MKNSNDIAELGSKSRAPGANRSSNDIADANEILRVTVGSAVLGVSVDETVSDRDEMGVFIEPPEYVLGLSGAVDTAVYRTQPEGARSGPGDIDRVRHSLRKYLALATKGNPNFLLPLFAPAKFIEKESLLGYELRELAPLIVSKNCIWQTVGYLRGQLKRLEEGKGKRFPNRPELIEQHGWDTKYGSHAVRLAIQAYELATTGRLELPMPQWAREYILSIKTGEETKENTIKEAQWWEGRAIDYLESGRSSLPDKPDFYTINRWMIRAHRMHWGKL